MLYIHILSTFREKRVYTYSGFVKNKSGILGTGENLV